MNALFTGKIGRDDAAIWPVLAAGLSALGLAAALLSQYVGGLQPCVLCVYQRWPHVAIILAAGAAVFLLRRGGPASAVRLLLALAAAAALTGAGIAAYHVGVEQGWWQGTDDCSAPFNAQSVDELRALLLAAPVVRCDEAVWSFLGLSMAAYNGLLSLVLAALCGYGVRRTAATDRGEVSS